ncbi:MAG: 16S rRNA (guanine(527)-N(7))-methyltransferase RsmG [Caldithrix sp.]|nr:MAG: 16S rRNA (guanine(527)-N(7))-methyltransferase RsmG [Caldithrix sp.]
MASGGSLRLKELKSRFAGAGLPLSQHQAEQFLLYHEELIKWNPRAKLISKRDEGRVLSRHFLECAGLTQFEEFAEGVETLDLGTGGGFPGLAMKIVRPDLKMTLLDSKRWKTLFLRSVIEKLGLSGTCVVCERVENLADSPGFRGRFDVVVCRAVTELAILYGWATPLLREGGVLVAVKGSQLSREQEEMRRAFPDVSVTARPLSVQDEEHKLKAVLCSLFDRADAENV